VGYSPWGHKQLDMTEATEHAQPSFNIQMTKTKCLPRAGFKAKCRGQRRELRMPVLQAQPVDQHLLGD